MTRILKTGLLAGASSVALVATAISPASAFDVVNWSWDAEVIETVTKNVTVGINVTPTGMVMVEDLQVSIGDIDAYSEVSGIYNNQPILGDPQGVGSETFSFEYDSDGFVVDGTQSPGVSADPGDTFVDEQPGGGVEGFVQVTVDLSEVDFELVGAAYDARSELPEVLSTATALANNASISSEVSVELHEGQFAFNTNGGPAEAPPQILDRDNTNLTAAAVLGYLAINDQIAPAQVQAISDVDDILNASVDSSATAVVNNLSVEVNADSSSDALVLADIVQFSNANAYADSIVSDVTLNNYTNLGLGDAGIQRPIVSSVATAVGNNKSITVTSPFSQ